MVNSPVLFWCQGQVWNTEKLGDFVQCNCVTPFQMPISDSNNCKKKALIRYLVNIQSSAENAFYIYV